MKKLIIIALSITTLSVCAGEGKKLWYYLRNNELGKSGVYYGYYASRRNFGEATCQTFLQTCINALKLGNFNSLQSGDFGIYRMSYLTNGITETVENVKDIYGGYYTALLFRADDGTVYAGEAYSSQSTHPITAPEDIFHYFSVTNALGDNIQIKSVVGYEACTTVKFRIPAAAVPLHVSARDDDSSLQVSAEGVNDVVEMLRRNGSLDNRAYRVTDSDASGNCRIRFASAPKLIDATRNDNTITQKGFTGRPMSIDSERAYFTIGNAVEGFRYRIITSPTLEKSSFVPDTSTEVTATEDGELQLSIPIGDEKKRFYRIEVL